MLRDETPGRVVGGAAAGRLASAAMAKPQKIPEGQAYRDAWAALDRDARRRVRRAVNRGQALDNRAEARVAVALARSQRSFWRWGWIVGPGIVLAFTIREEWPVVLANVGMVAVVVGAMSLYFNRRARRAEAANLAIVDRRKASKKQPRAGDEPPGDGKPPGAPTSKRSGKRKQRGS